MKVVWGSSSGQAQEGRETCAFFFFLIAFSLSIVLSERAKVNKAQEHRNDADRSRRHSAQNVRTASEKSTKNRSKIDENPCQIDQKSTKYRCWAILGAQDRFGDASGRAQDGLRTAKCRPKADLETPRAGQERPRDVQKRPWVAPKTFPDGLGAMSERVWSIEHHRARLRSDFSSILHRRAQAPKCVSYWFLQYFFAVAGNLHRTHASNEKPRKFKRFGLQKRARERPGDPKSSPG